MWVILRRFVSNARELATANAHDRRPYRVMKLRVTFHLKLAAKACDLRCKTGVHGSSSEGSLDKPPPMRSVPSNAVASFGCRNAQRSRDVHRRFLSPLREGRKLIHWPRRHDDSRNRSGQTACENDQCFLNRVAGVFFQARVRYRHPTHTMPAKWPNSSGAIVRLCRSR